MLQFLVLLIIVFVLTCGYYMLTMVPTANIIAVVILTMILDRPDPSYEYLAAGDF